MGVLPWGQMSFWGATVITNLLSPFPSNRMGMWRTLCLQSNIEEVLSLSFLTPISSLRLNTNNKIPFFPFIFLKDVFSLFLILSLFILHFPFGVYSLSHPDNALEVCGFVTPLHIVPEWY